MSLPDVRIVDRARIDLAGIQAWLTQPGSGRKGRARYIAILAAVLELRNAPLRWPVGDQEGIRERPFDGHRISYRFSPEVGRIEVLRVFAPFQDRPEP